VRITLIFSRIISFMLFTVLLLHMYFFEEFLIHNSRVAFHGGSSHFFSIGIYPVSDTAGIGFSVGIIGV
jgi:hypothetical protein